MPKLAKRLTDIQIRNLKAKVKPYRQAAGRGLFLLVKPDSSKHWVFRFQFESKESSLSFGRYPEVSLLDAEAKATEAHALIEKGANPSHTRKAEKTSKKSKASNSFELIARE